jgi:ketosteroid isomerase-like protein
MSRENVELVQRLQPSDVDLVELFVRGDIAGVFDPTAADSFAEGFEVRFISKTAGDLSAEYRGPEGMVQGWRDWLEPWESYRLVAEELIDAGDDVVAFVRVQGRTARDAVEVEHSPAAIWTIEDGKVVRIRFYLEREDALREAGLLERGAAGDSA